MKCGAPRRLACGGSALGDGGGWRIDYLCAEGGTLLVEPGGRHNLALAARSPRCPYWLARPAAYARGGVCSRYARGVPAMARRHDGDIHGAAGELVELAVLLVMAVI